MEKPHGNAAPAGGLSDSNAGLGTEFLHEGKTYITVPANCCDKCTFYWRDGGIYDACEHPDQTLVNLLCGADNRKKGVNLSWVEKVTHNVK